MQADLEKSLTGSPLNSVMPSPSYHKPSKSFAISVTKYEKSSLVQISILNPKTQFFPEIHFS